jgi:CheY-like chemotaxis protein
VVEDDKAMRAVLYRALTVRDWSVQTAGDGLSALQILDAMPSFDAVLADARIPGPNGVMVLEYARGLSAEARLVLFSGWLTSDDRTRAAAINAATVTKGATDSLELLLTVLEET